MASFVNIHELFRPLADGWVHKDMNDLM